ncbi:acyl-CoA synthetase [uncultured Nocardioides sp.]|uniref:acyl-CoA synthetase n=1 Tax=uncultured Nocardioides sp. TaxID=198441 RepID=UPI002638AB2E|nr:acyl-CoA synthetase [uncultured Nocardioides sp.]
MFPGTHAATQPDKPAIVHTTSGVVRTYADLESRSVRLARYLREQGLGEGDDVAFLSGNLPEVFEVYWAGLRSGFVVTGVNHHLTAGEVAYILGDCDARALLVSRSCLELAGAALAELGDAIGIRVLLDPGEDGAPAGWTSYDEVQGTTSDAPLADQPRGVDMLYSSGTTGRPKGVKAPLPGHGIDERLDLFTMVFAPAYGFDTDTVYYSAAPTYHAAPLRFGGVVHATGGTVVMADRFDAEDALEVIQTHRVTHSQWVPTMFVRMLKLPEEVRASYDVSSLRVAVHAAAPCPVEVKQRMIDWWGPVLHEYYSSTEANGITMVTPDEWLERPGTVGQAKLGVVRICGHDGAEVPTGDTGIVYFERDVRPFSYHKDDAKTAAATHPDHPTWTTTGDIGHVDADGYLYLTDRAAFTIISGGVNVYPQEIEDALALHPAILDVAVVGAADDDLGQVPVAVVQPADGVEPSPALAEEILADLQGRIARFKVPRELHFVDALPRSATGKLVKKDLAARFA